MKLFSRKPDHSVCRVCGVHYEPTEGRWNEYCGKCREPIQKLDERRDSVVLWAKANWERLEPMYLEEHRESQAKYNQAIQKTMNAAAGQQANTFAQMAGYGLGLYQRKL